MLTHKVKYKDFNGTTREDEVFFNLTEAEIIDIQMESERGVQEDLKEALANEDKRALLEFVKKMIFLAYGEKSPDGRYHHKSPEILSKFKNSALYSKLLMDLFTDESGDRLAAFMNGLMPQDMLNSAKEQAEAQKSILIASDDNPVVNYDKPIALVEVAKTGNVEVEKPIQLSHESKEDAAYAEFLAWKASQNS